MKITVVGLGHLGTVAAGGLSMAGHRVTGVDIDTGRIEQLRDGIAPIYEPGLSEWLAAGADRGCLSFFHVNESAEPLGDIVMVATGTPASANGEADLSQIRSALAWVKSRDPANAVLVMKSTVPPGSGAAFLHRELNGLEVAYVSNPEFLREGRALHDWQFPDRIVIGADDRNRHAVGAVKRMYADINAPCLVTDITSAEMLKYASNAFLATRISFINEIASLCDSAGASIDAVSEGLAMDARMGDKIHAGIGYGGSCFPKDIRALDRAASAAGIEMPLLKSVSAVNDRQRLLPLSRLRSRFGGSVAGLTVGVLGLAFKPGTSDIRDAPSLAIVNALADEGARVQVYDPQAMEPARRLLPSSVTLVASSECAAERAEALLLLTEWAEIVEADWASIADSMRLPKFLFDGRNALDASLMIRSGFEYAGVGRGFLDTAAVRNGVVSSASFPGMQLSPGAQMV